jgi:S-DNA-T family DNA segregation ATPase FtsK/SpoIIIE
MEADDLTGVAADLSRAGMLLAGPAGSGRTTALATLAAGAARKGIRVVAPTGDPTGALAALVGEVDAPDGVAAPTLVLVDDLEEWVGEGAEPEADELICSLVRAGRRQPVRLVAAGTATALRRSWADSVGLLRGAGHGLLLGPEAHDLGGILHTDVSPREDVPHCLGRAWLVAESAARLLQVARP